MSPIVITVEIHGRKLEIGCYGAGSDWLCRITDPDMQPAAFSDCCSPPPDLGFFWQRERYGMWLASGLVSLKVFRDQGTLIEVLDAVMEQALHLDYALAMCVELVEPKFTSITDHELPDRFLPGGATE
jgi:hypothetical protein